MEALITLDQHSHLGCWIFIIAGLHKPLSLWCLFVAQFKQVLHSLPFAHSGLFPLPYSISICQNPYSSQNISSPQLPSVTHHHLIGLPPALILPLPLPSCTQSALSYIVFSSCSLWILERQSSVFISSCNFQHSVLHLVYSQ